MPSMKAVVTRRRTVSGTLFGPSGDDVCPQAAVVPNPNRSRAKANRTEAMDTRDQSPERVEKHRALFRQQKPDRSAEGRFRVCSSRSAVRNRKRDRPSRRSDAPLHVRFRCRFSSDRNDSQERSLTLPSRGSRRARLPLGFVWPTHHRSPSRMESETDDVAPLHSPMRDLFCPTQPSPDRFDAHMHHLRAGLCGSTAQVGGQHDPILLH